MYGICCCRHASEFLKDILDVLGINSILMYIFIDDYDIWHKVNMERADNGSLISLDVKTYNTLLYYQNSNIEIIGKTLKKYYVYRDLGIKHVFNY